MRGPKADIRLTRQEPLHIAWRVKKDRYGSGNVRQRSVTEAYHRVKNPIWDEPSFMAEKWSLTGNYFEACNCDVACPCVFTSAPTEGNCTVLLAWHIEKGKYGDISLDGLNAALAIYSPGHMLKVKWDVALYLDQKATAKQREALTSIYGGQAGGEPAALAPLIGKILGVKSVPIEFNLKGKERSMRIPGIAEMAVTAMEGAGGREITLEHIPFTAVPNETTVVAKSKKLSLHDHGMKWEVSDKNGFFSPFRYKSS